MSKWTGVLKLDMENRQGRTVAKKVYFQGAFKVMRPVYHNNGNTALYYVLIPFVGYFDSYTYSMTVSLDVMALLTLTTQSSTKVYKTPTSHAYQETSYYLKKDSYLEYLPDALIAYKDATYYQKNVVHMDEGATLLYSDRSEERRVGKE